MIDITLVEDNFKKLSTDELIDLAKKPEQLNREVIPLLQKELINRNKPEEAITLSNYLVNGPEKVNLSLEELQEETYERMQSGESIESIKFDLKEKGINTFDVIDNDNKRKNKVFDYIISLKDLELEDSEINQRLQEKYSITEEECEILKTSLKNKGRQNLIIGFASVGITLIIVPVVLSAGGSVGLGAIMIFGLGIWRIAEGTKQRR
jgi:hypothetical protein